VDLDDSNWHIWFAVCRQLDWCAFPYFIFGNSYLCIDRTESLVPMEEKKMKLYLIIGMLVLLALSACSDGSSFKDCQDACYVYDSHALQIRQDFCNSQYKQNVTLFDCIEWGGNGTRDAKAYCYQQCYARGLQ
jgi:hypothetical protein